MICGYHSMVIYTYITESSTRVSKGKLTNLESWIYHLTKKWKKGIFNQKRITSCKKSTPWNIYIYFVGWLFHKLWTKKKNTQLNLYKSKLTILYCPTDDEDNKTMKKGCCLLIKSQAFWLMIFWNKYMR